MNWYQPKFWSINPLYFIWVVPVRKDYFIFFLDSYRFYLFGKRENTWKEVHIPYGTRLRHPLESRVADGRQWIDISRRETCKMIFKIFRCNRLWVQQNHLVWQKTVIFKWERKNICIAILNYILNSEFCRICKLCFFDHQNDPLRSNIELTSTKKAN